MQMARNIIMRGCEVCSKNEDVWVESIRLQVSNILKKTIAGFPVKHYSTVLVQTRHLE